MKKFLIGLMLSWMVMISCSIVGNCMVQQTKESVYLPIGENSWFKLEVERQSQSNNHINLPEDWHKKVTTARKVVDKRPSANSVRAALQNGLEFNFIIPIKENVEGILAYLGPRQVASFCIKLSDNTDDIEKIINETTRPQQVIEAKLMNIGAGITYEKVIESMERELDIPETDPLSVLNVQNFQIIPFSIGNRAYGGCLLIPDMDAPLGQSFAWFTRGGGQQKNKFQNLETVLNDYWQSMELKEKAFSNASAPFRSLSPR
ncbi:MAG: hypothetical protein LBL38_03465 [Lactobacillales bacterium]|jgi:hypothetical protein|nr:hypothetical protein [Lactobacillales bacterium]